MQALREKPAKSVLDRQFVLAWLCAIGLHIGIGAIWLYGSVVPEPLLVPNAITVDLVEIKSTNTGRMDIKSEPIETTKTRIPIVKPRAKPTMPDRSSHSIVHRQITNSGPVVDDALDPETTQPNTDGLGQPAKTYIPSRWVLEPPLAENRLKAFGLLDKDIHCLRSLSDECKDMRREIFVEYQLNQTELVWTPLRADTGMPAEFYGLSDVEIMEKLNVPVPGQNGLSVPLLGTIIDGPIWDAMHGVNKGCKLVRSLDPNAPLGVKKICPRTLPRPD